MSGGSKENGSTPASPFAHLLKPTTPANPGDMMEVLAVAKLEAEYAADSAREVARKMEEAGDRLQEHVDSLMAVSQQQFDVFVAQEKVELRQIAIEEREALTKHLAEMLSDHLATVAQKIHSQPAPAVPATKAGAGEGGGFWQGFTVAGLMVAVVVGAGLYMARPKVLGLAMNHEDGIALQRGYELQKAWDTMTPEMQLKIRAAIKKANQ